jgi:hypothetical protein
MSTNFLSKDLFIDFIIDPSTQGNSLFVQRDDLATKLFSKSFVQEKRLLPVEYPSSFEYMNIKLVEVKQPDNFYYYAGAGIELPFFKFKYFPYSLQIECIWRIVENPYFLEFYLNPKNPDPLFNEPVHVKFLETLLYFILALIKPAMEAGDDSLLPHFVVRLIDFPTYAEEMEFYQSIYKVEFLYHDKELIFRNVLRNAGKI